MVVGMAQGAPVGCSQGRVVGMGAPYGWSPVAGMVQGGCVGCSHGRVVGMTQGSTNSWSPDRVVGMVQGCCVGCSQGRVAGNG